ncbi:MAG TPA: TonB-dependent receptor [Candidatus Aquabacterium excrementipullorum]|nr:TonB-dependent receptor [Candidatus Aquabacterium excrementipullorum]
MLVPLSAMAQQAAEQQLTQNTELPAVKVQATKIDPNPNAELGAPYKAKTSGDVRHTRPLAETPQTISVITKTAIDDSGFTDLKQILSAQPGITLGTGENGNSFGDRYIIRGQEARSDVFVDGLRDPGMSTRESFAIEQVEISKGPNSSFAGRGTAGGAVNAITKQATLDLDFNRVSASLGSDDHVRLAADVNKAFTDNFALRANVLYSDEDVPGRSPSSRNRKGLALSGLWEINNDLSVTVDYYGLRGKDDYPDLGGYLVGTVPNRKPANNVPVYAQDSDFLQSNQDTLTARVKFRVSADTSINSLTRYGSSRNSYITTGASYGARYNGTTTTPYNTAYIDNGHTGWQDVNYFAHQTNLRLDRVIGGKKNEFILGAEYTDHMVVSGSYNLNQSGFNCRNPVAPAGSPAGTPVVITGALNSYCFISASGAAVSNLGGLATRNPVRLAKTQEWHARTLAASVMDTVDLTDKFTAFGGLRFDQLELTLNRFNNTTGAKTSHYAYDETLINGHLGLSYKIAPKGIIYASWASAQDVNGGEPDSGTSAGYGGLVVNAAGQAGSQPEKSVSYELGTKWNLLDEKLLFTAAYFHTDKSNVMEGLTNADYTTAGTFNTGGNRVRGLEFGLTGNVTEKFSVQAGAAFMKSKVTKSFTSSLVGKELANFADQTFSLQGKYEITSALSLGAAARHESGRCGGQPDTGVTYTNGSCNQPVPSFTVYDLFGSYRFSRRLDVRVNVMNVEDKDYYTAVYRSGSFLYKGDGRATRVTVNYEF